MAQHPGQLNVTANKYKSSNLQRSISKKQEKKSLE